MTDRLSVSYSPPRLIVTTKVPTLTISTGVPIVRDTDNYPWYEGSYEFTPGETEQTISTTNNRMASDVVIHAIPSNYGRISWNGTTLSVY